MQPLRIPRLWPALFIVLTNSVLAHCAQILGLFINGHRSHLLVYTAVVRLLLQRGHNVTLVTTLDLGDLHTDEYTNLRHIQLTTNHTVHRVACESSNTPLRRISEITRRIEHTSGFLQDPVWRAFLAERQTFQLLLLGYLFNDYQLGVAAHFGCPAVLIWTGQPIGYVQRLLGNPEERSYVAQPYDKQQRSGIKALALRLFEQAVETVTLRAMERVYKYFPAPHYVGFWEVRKNVALVLCHHHSLSEGPIAPQVPGLVEIGGIRSQWSADMTQKLIAANDSQLIFLSLGTREKWSQFAPRTVDAFLQALKHFPQYTVYWTYDGDCAALTANASNIQCAPWWPQNALLAQPQLRLFITHGGKGSVSEAQFHGVPMLGLPVRGDQWPNVERLVARGFGLRLDLATLTAQQLIEAVAQLTQNHTYRATVQQFALLYRDRPLSAQQATGYWIEYVLRHGGAAHLRSARLQLNVWQYLLLDIYAAIALGFVVFRAVCRWLERRLDAV